MKVVVLGAGVIGVTTAYYLAEDGHEVTVIDRNAEAASETSYGNAGFVSPGDSYAWASPDALKMFFRSLYRRDLGIKVKPSLDPHFLEWTAQFLRECLPARTRNNSLRKLRLALYSRDCLNGIAGRTVIDYDARQHGILYFYRTQASLDHGADHMRLLAEHGLKIEIVDRHRLAEIEPALAAAKDKLAGGIFCPLDQTGDSSKFTRRLAAWCAKAKGVEFASETNILAVEANARSVRRVMTDKGAFAADAFVLALGAESPRIVRPIGISLPICPVKGYSMTVRLEGPDVGPRLGGVDEDRLVAYSRLGDRLRVASTAEFAGFDRGHRSEDFRAIRALAGELFPQGFDPDTAEYWAGLRPMTPSSVPILGRARYDNLFLNVGHGHVGWTMAAGSGKLVADMMSGRKPEIDPEGLTYEG